MALRSNNMETLLHLAQQMPPAEFREIVKESFCTLVTVAFDFVATDSNSNRNRGETHGLFKSVRGVVVNAVTEFEGELVSSDANTLLISWPETTTISANPLECALQIERSLRELRQLGLEIGVGVSRGRVVRQTIAASGITCALFQGECVEAGSHAARLSASAPRTYGVLITNSVKHDATTTSPPRFHFLSVEAISTRANEENGIPPMPLHEVRKASFADPVASAQASPLTATAMAKHNNPNRGDFVHLYNRAFQHYRSRNFSEALRQLTHLHDHCEEHRNDPLVTHLIRMCNQKIRIRPESSRAAASVSRIIPEWRRFEDEDTSEARSTTTIIPQPDEPRDEATNGYSAESQAIHARSAPSDTEITPHRRICESWRQLQELNSDNAVGLRFYEILSSLDPFVGVFFDNVDINDLSRRVFNMIGESITALIDPSTYAEHALIDRLYATGVMHAKMGISQHNLDCFTQAMLRTLDEFLSQGFTDDLRSHWLVGLSTITGLMARGMGDEEALLGKRQFDAVCDAELIQLWPRFESIERQAQSDGLCTAHESLLIRTWHRRSIVKNPKLKHIAFFLRSENDGIVFRFLTTVIKKLQESRETATELIESCGRRHTSYHVVNVSDVSVTESTFLDACREVMTIRGEPLTQKEEDRIRRFIAFVAQALSTGMIKQLADDAHARRRESSAAPSGADAFKKALAKVAETAPLGQPSSSTSSGRICPFQLAMSKSQSHSDYNNHHSSSMPPQTPTYLTAKVKTLESTSTDKSATVSTQHDDYDDPFESVSPAPRTPQLQKAELPTTILSRNGTHFLRSEQILGRGSFGSVYMGMEKHSSKLVALKALPLPEDQTTLESIAAEIEIMELAQHANVVGFLDYAVVEETKQIVLVMECVASGSLSTILEGFGKVPLESACNFIRDVLCGLAKLHSLGILHQDIKPHNVLLATTGQCKITDFGAAARLADLAIREGYAVRGTALYLAPEAARGCPCAASDVWSVAVMLVELVTGAVPYSVDPQKTGVLYFVQKLGAGQLSPQYNTKEFEKDPRVLDFLQRCFNTNPTTRDSAASLLMLPLFQGN